MNPGRALLLIAPLVGGGVVQAVVIRWDLFPRLRRIPLDLGATFRGHRVFGTNKTLRGALAMIFGTALCAWALFSAVPPYEPVPSFGWSGLGALMGIGYVVAELPNSFVKRQVGIAPGHTGRARKVQYVVDQCDSVVGVVLVLWAVTDISASDLAAFAILGVVVHVLFDVGLHRVGVKGAVTPRPPRGPRS